MFTPEHLSGFFIIQAKDIDEAAELACNMPLAAIGSIEIRPLDQVERRQQSGKGLPLIPPNPPI